jgi:hypothetical protein
VIYVEAGTRKETEPGFAYIIETYEYFPFLQGKRVKHKHKSLQLLIYEEAKALVYTLDEKLRIQ